MPAAQISTAAAERWSACQAVEAVGEVDRVRRRDDHDDTESPYHSQAGTAPTPTATSSAAPATHEEQHRRDGGQRELRAARAGRGSSGLADRRRRRPIAPIAMHANEHAQRERVARQRAAAARPAARSPNSTPPIVGVPVFDLVRLAARPRMRSAARPRAAASRSAAPSNTAIRNAGIPRGQRHDQRAQAVRRCARRIDRDVPRDCEAARSRAAFDAPDKLRVTLARFRDAAGVSLHQRVRAGGAPGEDDDRRLFVAVAVRVAEQRALDGGAVDVRRCAERFRAAQVVGVHDRDVQPSAAASSVATRSGRPGRGRSRARTAAACRCSRRSRRSLHRAFRRTRRACRAARPTMCATAAHSTRREPTWSMTSCSDSGWLIVASGSGVPRQRQRQARRADHLGRDEARLRDRDGRLGDRDDVAGARDPAHGVAHERCEVVAGRDQPRAHGDRDEALRQAALADGDRDHANTSAPSASAICSILYTREPLSSTASPRRRFARSHATASSLLS